MFLKLVWVPYVHPSYVWGHTSDTCICDLDFQEAGLPNPIWPNWNWVCKHGKHTAVKNSYEWEQQEPLSSCGEVFPFLSNISSLHSSTHGHSQLRRGVPAPRGLCCASRDNARVLMGTFEKNLICPASRQRFYLGLMLVYYLFSETNDRPDFHLQLSDWFRNTLLMSVNNEPRCVSAFLNWVLPQSQ